MRNPRRSYAARVLVIPLSHADEALRGELEALGLANIDWLSAVQPENGSHATYRRATLHAPPGRDAAPPAPLETFVEQADVVVLLARTLDGADVGLLHAGARASRNSGALIASVLVGDADSAPDGHRVLAALREATDMLVNVRDLTMVAGFLDVIRGGYRDAEQRPTSTE